MSLYCIKRSCHLGLNPKWIPPYTWTWTLISYAHAESRGAVGVRVAGCQNPAEDQERGDSNSGAWKVGMINERNIHHGEKFFLQGFAFDSLLCARCVNMLREVFRHWFYCFRRGLQSPFPTGNFPALLAPEEALRTHISAFVLSSLPPFFRSEWKYFRADFLKFWRSFSQRKFLIIDRSLKSGCRAPEADRDWRAGDPAQGEGTDVDSEVARRGRGVQGPDHRRRKEVKESSILQGKLSTMGAGISTFWT